MGNKKPPPLPPMQRARAKDAPRSKPAARPWSEPPVELSDDELVPMAPAAAEEIELNVDFDAALPARDAPFSDVTPSVWSNIDLGKLASPLFAPQPWTPPAAEERTAWTAVRELGTRVATAIRLRRAWAAGAAIAILGGVGTFALVSLARRPSADDMKTAIVAAATTDPRAGATDKAAAAPSPPVEANDTPLADNAMPNRAPKKGSMRDKAIDAPPRAPATAHGSRTSDSASSHAQPAVRESAAPAPASKDPAPPARSDPSPSAAPSFPGIETADEFNRTAAMESMRQAGDSSRACVTGGASGGARVAVTFARSGSVSDVGVEGALAGTPAANCIAAKFRALHIPPFRGSSVTVRRTLSF